MTTSILRNLFVVAFLSIALSACSSKPVASDDAAAKATKENADAKAAKESMDAKAASDAVAAQAAADAKAAQPTNAAGQTADEIFASIQGKVVNFPFNRSDIAASFYPVIKQNADYMSLNTAAMVTVKGYCDDRGTREYNLALGERRANAVKNALIAEGVSPSRITVVSFGEEDPIDPANNELAWAKNRRAEFSY